MQGTAIEAPEQTQQQSLQRLPAVVLAYRVRAQRGTPLPGATADNATAIVERVLSSTQLDTATRCQLARILHVTAQLWARK